MFQNTIEEETQQWFCDTSEFYSKRKHVAAIIEDLSQENLTKAGKILPSLKFQVPVMRSDPSKPAQREQATVEETLANVEGQASVRSDKSGTNLCLENASEEGKQELEKIKAPVTAVVTKQSELVKSETKEQDIITTDSSAEFIASKKNGEKKRDEESRSQNEDLEKAPQSHPSEIINMLPREKKNKFKANFQKLCMHHQQLLFKKMLICSSPEFQKFIISYIIEKENVCEHHHQHNKFPSKTSSASFIKKDQKLTLRSNKNRRRKCKAKNDDSESRRIELIQRFRKWHMTRLEVWGCGFLTK